MSTDSKIEWTDHTFNAWWGCTKVHSGCANCYAETMDHRYGGDHWGKDNPRRMIVGEWAKPAQWNAAAKAAGVRARVFCMSMGDLFEDFDGPVLDQLDRPVEMRQHPGRFWTVPLLRHRVFQIIEETPWLDWLLLSKRPENMVGMVPVSWRDRFPSNVMVGTSPCDQKTADVCIPALLEVPARRFLSVEPLLGPVNLGPVLGTECTHEGSCQEEDTGANVCHECEDYQTGIHWVIVGGESGAGAREIKPEWVRSIRNDCNDSGVPFLFKQWGGVNKKLTGRELDGRTWDEFPATTQLAGDRRGEGL